MLTCHNITFMRDNRLLFENLGFTLGAHGLLIINGANGSGKTTLLKIITGIILADSGAISWNKHDISENYEYYKSSIMYIAHQGSINPLAKVKANLEFWAYLFNTEERLMAAIHYFKLHKVLELECRKLSAGWAKRVALAKLLISDAGLWLLDEPTANLDKETTTLLLDLIDVFREKEGMVIITSNKNLEYPDDDIKYSDKLYIEDFVENNSNIINL